MSTRCKKHSDCRKYKAIGLACSKNEKLSSNSLLVSQHYHSYTSSSCHNSKYLSVSSDSTDIQFDLNNTSSSSFNSYSSSSDEYLSFMPYSYSLDSWNNYGSISIMLAGKGDLSH